MDRALYVDDHAEFWLTPTEHAIAGHLEHLATAQTGWGLTLNWDKVQVLAQAMGKGSKRRFPNHGRVQYFEHALGGHHTAKYLEHFSTKQAHMDQR